MSWLSELTGIDINALEYDAAGNITGTTSPDFNITDKNAAALTGLLGGSALIAASGIGTGSTRPSGYQGSIPDYRVKRDRVPNTYDSTRRPGSGGQRYFTDTQYETVTEGTVAPTPATAEGLATLNKANPARQTIPAAATTDTTNTTDNTGITNNTSAAASSVVDQLPVPTYDAEGNVIQLAAGGIAALKKGKYLNGATDGMADKVPANIDGVQEAALSDGEFVIPADVVSHLGNGNSDAGAKVLTKMMARIRKVRTGNNKQGKEINPNKFLPA